LMEDAEAEKAISAKETVDVGMVMVVEVRAMVEVEMAKAAPERGAAAMAAVEEPSFVRIQGQPQTKDHSAREACGQWRRSMRSEPRRTLQQLRGSLHC